MKRLCVDDNAPPAGALPVLALLFAVLSLAGCATSRQLWTSAEGPPIPPERVDPAQTSADPTYGRSPENPIRVGAGDLSRAPGMSNVYLRHLCDSNYQRFAFRRMGSRSGNPDGHIVDHYVLKSTTGETIDLYIDMYHPECTPLSQPAPAGMYIWK